MEAAGLSRDRSEPFLEIRHGVLCGRFDLRLSSATGTSSFSAQTLLIPVRIALGPLLGDQASLHHSLTISRASSTQRQSENMVVT